jgi:hypothetical protein
MSSRRFPRRPAATALALAVLLTLAALPAQAAQGPTLLDHLGAKVQTWLASWLPGVRVEGVGRIERNSGATFGDQGRQAGHHGRAVHPVIKPQCDSSPSSDPNGCPPR